MDLERGVIDTALDVLDGDIETLRAEARAEFERVPGQTGVGWGHNTFRKYPAFKHSDGRVFVLHPGFLLDRCTVDAYELKVRMQLRSLARDGDGEAKSLEGSAGGLIGIARERY